MKQHFGLDLSRQQHRMEEVFNYLYSDVHGSLPSPEALEAYWLLLRIYADALAKTTNTLEGMSRFGVGALLRLLLPSPSTKRSLTFVTFNHDLVIEKAIENTKSMAKYHHLNLRAMALVSRLVFTKGAQPFSTADSIPSSS
jgi:hypothetical protein